MKIRWISVIYTIVMLVLLQLMLGCFGRNDFTKRDIVYYNDLVWQIKAAYNAGMAVSDIEKEYNCEIILNDDKDYAAKLYKYYEDYGLVMDFLLDDITDSSEHDKVYNKQENLKEDKQFVIGKICFAVEKNTFYSAKENVRRSVIAIWIGLLVIGYVFIFVIYYSYIRPFHELQHFTTEIAKGNLDVALPIHKENMFGAFTESFDVMREELAASRVREAEAEKSKKELVAQLSHDIKTPVATIKATCEVLEMQEQMRLNELRHGIGEMTHECLTGEQQRKIDTDSADKEIIKIKGKLEKIGFISKKSDTINELINNMFQATLEELEELVVTPEETESVIIDSFFRELSSYGNIIIDNKLPECLVYMDRLRMEQVIGNVIGNSSKYAGTDIVVSYKIIDSTENEKYPGQRDFSGRTTDRIYRNDQYLCITVRDYGKGISDDEIYSVTEKFYRGQNSSGKQGSGLGLYLAKYFMEKQMGGFECYNHKSAGNENDGFVIELYLKKV